jgi:hypothetical protein
MEGGSAPKARAAPLPAGGVASSNAGVMDFCARQASLRAGQPTRAVEMMAQRSEPEGGDAMDFSCYCYIPVWGCPPLTLTGKGDSHGRWEHSPSHTLVDGETSWNPFQLADNFGFFGSAGWVEYATPDGTTFRMSFSCPTGNNSNTATVTCTGPSCGQFTYIPQLMSGCTPVDWTTPRPDANNCNGSLGPPWQSPYNHPVIAVFNLTGPYSQPKSP